VGWLGRGPGALYMSSPARYAVGTSGMSCCRGGKRLHGVQSGREAAVASGCCQLMVDQVMEDGLERCRQTRVRRGSRAFRVVVGSNRCGVGSVGGH
jgi:hypothetical protein